MMRRTIPKITYPRIGAGKATVDRVTAPPFST
jgi:hypothetical protein